MMPKIVALLLVRDTFPFLRCSQRGSEIEIEIRRKKEREREKESDNTEGEEEWKQTTGMMTEDHSFGNNTLSSHSRSLFLSSFFLGLSTCTSAPSRSLYKDTGYWNVRTNIPPTFGSFLNDTSNRKILVSATLGATTCSDNGVLIVPVQAHTRAPTVPFSIPHTSHTL